MLRPPHAAVGACVIRCVTYAPGNICDGHRRTCWIGCGGRHRSNIIEFESSCLPPPRDSRATDLPLTGCYITSKSTIRIQEFTVSRRLNRIVMSLLIAISQLGFKFQLQT